MRSRRCGAPSSICRSSRRRRTADRALRLFAVGRARPGPQADLFAEYNRRLRPPLAVTELPEGVGAPAEIKRREAATLLAAFPANAFVVALDGSGQAPDSVAFARLLQGWIEFARPVCFAIGGAEGLDPGVLTRADYVFSLGALTWPHLLVRGLLAEQLFRARSIAANHPYHRS